MTTALICDDHRLVRDALRSVIVGVPGVQRVATAASGEEVLARYPAERPDLVLMDVRMPGIGGLEATRRLVRAFPEATVIMLTAAEDREAVVLAVSYGARGYLHKDVSREQLCAAVAGALAGQSRTSAPPTVTERIPAQPTGGLTDRERQVLEGMSHGRSNAEIGRTLYLSEDTIKTHARRLFRKLGVNDRAQAVALGFRRGLVS